MRSFRNTCIVLCVANVLFAITGISGFYMNGTVIEAEHLDVPGRLWALLFATTFGAFAYGIHKRASATWTAGLVLYAIVSAILFIDMLSFTLRLPTGERWIAAIGGSLGFGAIIIYCGSWWIRQKPYFRSGKTPG